MKRACLNAVLSAALVSQAGVAMALDAVEMARAFPAGGKADIAEPRVKLARDLAQKSLGDDLRDLVFVPVTPCTVFDTRFAAAAPQAGAIGPGMTRQFYSHLDGAGASFTAYGGNPACAEANETFLGGRPYAVMMTVYVNNPAGNGWLTFYRDGDADPSPATISVYYSPGPTRTQTVIAKSSRGYGTGTYDIAVTGRFSTAHASAAVVGYFIKPVNITLPPSSADSGNILKGASRFIHNFGTGNTFVGVDAGNVTMTGAHLTGIGHLALGANTTGGDNTAVGGQALADNTTGFSNTAVGYLALANNESGSNNTATGSVALFNNTGGAFNTAYGDSALQSITMAFGNTGLGYGTLYGNSTGSGNIAIGHLGGQNLVLDFNIAIGNDGNAADTGTIRIGKKDTHARAFIAGIRSTTTANADAVPVMIDSAGQLGTVNSSRRVKDHVADMAAASSALMKLRPVTFQYKTHAAGTGALQYGLIAEEVAEVYPGLVARSADGEVETVMYQYLPVMLLNELQKQAARIAELEAQLRARR